MSCHDALDAWDAGGAADVDSDAPSRFDGDMKDRIIDIAAWLESRHVTVGPVDEDALVGIGHAQAQLSRETPAGDPLTGVESFPQSAGEAASTVQGNR